MTSEQIQAEIDRLNARLKPLLAERDALNHQCRDARSREFIAANRITLDQVQLSSGDGVPWFGDLKPFADWLIATKCRKRWAEWNGCLFMVSELSHYRADWSTTGYLEHVPA